MKEDGDGGAEKVASGRRETDRRKVIEDDEIYEIWRKGLSRVRVLRRGDMGMEVNRKRRKSGRREI